MTPVRIGLIGCGGVTRMVHFPLLVKFGARLVALADSDATALRGAGLRFPAAVCCSAEELVRLQEVEAVVIGAPTDQHGSLARAALASGKHVYLEKPLASSLEDAIGLDNEPGRVAQLGFNLRFHPLILDLRRRLHEGRIGTLLNLRSTFTTAGTPTTAWRLRRESGGGALLDLASHHLDLMRYLTGQEAVRVEADIQSRVSQDDTVSIQIRLSEGATYQGFFAFNCVEADTVELSGSQGRMSVERYISAEVDERPADGSGERLRQLRQMLRWPARLPYLVQKFRSPWHEPSYAPAIASFLNSVRAGRLLEGASFQDGLRNLELIAAVERAAREAPADGLRSARDASSQQS